MTTLCYLTGIMCMYESNEKAKNRQWTIVFCFLLNSKSIKHIRFVNIHAYTQMKNEKRENANTLNKHIIYLFLFILCRFIHIHDFILMRDISNFPEIESWKLILTSFKHKKLKKKIQILGHPSDSVTNKVYGLTPVVWKSFDRYLKHFISYYSFKH